MSGKFCVLRSGFSEREALACEPGKRLSHRHLSRKQAKELLRMGDIVEFDLHPATLLPRFVWRQWDRAKPLPGSTVITRNAGAGEFHEINHARRVIANINSEPSAMESVTAGQRWVRLPIRSQDATLFYDGESNRKVGRPIMVRFRARNPESLEIVRDYFEWTKRGSRAGSELLTKATAKLNFRAWRTALERLDVNWKHIVAEFSANELTQIFNESSASELPAMFLRAVLTSYLH
jgi:hypothetical protein